MEFQKQGLYFMMKREQDKLQTFNSNQNHISPMWIELQIDFKIYKQNQKSLSDLNRIHRQIIG